MSQIRTSGLSKEAEARLKRGAAMTSVLNQDRHAPNSMEQEIFMLYALNKGILDLLSSEQLKEFKSGFYSFVLSSAPELIQSLRTEKSLTQEGKEKLNQKLKEYFERRPTQSGK